MADHGGRQARHRVPYSLPRMSQVALPALARKSQILFLCTACRTNSSSVRRISTTPRARTLAADLSCAPSRPPTPTVSSQLPGTDVGSFFDLFNDRHSPCPALVSIRSKIGRSRQRRSWRCMHRAAIFLACIGSTDRVGRYERSRDILRLQPRDGTANTHVNHSVPRIIGEPYSVSIVWRSGSSGSAACRAAAPRIPPPGTNPAAA